VLIFGRQSGATPSDVPAPNYRPETVIPSLHIDYKEAYSGK
jgi:hypothetical protein